MVHDHDLIRGDGHKVHRFVWSRPTWGSWATNPCQQWDVEHLHSPNTSEMVKLHLSHPWQQDQEFLTVAVGPREKTTAKARCSESYHHGQNICLLFCQNSGPWSSRWWSSPWVSCVSVVSWDLASLHRGRRRRRPRRSRRHRRPSILARPRSSPQAEWVLVGFGGFLSRSLLGFYGFCIQNNIFLGFFGLDASF